MGILRTFGIVAGYLTFLHLGTFDGLQREIPLQMGRGYPGKAAEAAAACLSWVGFVAICAAVVFAGLAVHSLSMGEQKSAAGWAAYVIVIVGTFYGGYLGTTYRTGQQFVTLSKVSVIQALVGIAALPAVVLFGYFGACFRFAAVSSTQVAFLHRWRPLRVRPRIDPTSFFRVIRVGLPLSLIGYLSTSLWVSLEGTLILAWFGNEVLGLYTLAFFVRTMLAQLAQSLSQVVSVRITEQYGRTGRVGASLRVALKPTAAAAAAAIPVLALMWMLVPPAIRILTPKYVEGTLLVQLVLPILLITILRLPTAVLWSAAKWLDCLWAAAVGFVMFVSLAVLGHRNSWGVQSVIVASLCGQLATTITGYLLVYRQVSRERTARRS